MGEGAEDVLNTTGILADEKKNLTKFWKSLTIISECEKILSTSGHA